MIEQKIQFNPAQQIGVLLQAKNKADIWGRGTGKSAGIAWDINLINRTMSRALTAVTGQTSAFCHVKPLLISIRASGDDLYCRPPDRCFLFSL